MIISPGSRWKHYKGSTVYVVVCVAEHVDTRQRLVVYRPLDVVGRNWARPEADFLGTVFLDETSPGVKRYERVSE